MKNSISWGAFLVGGGIGAAVAYFVAKSTIKQEKQEEVKIADTKLPPPPGPEGAATKGPKGHRAPQPNARAQVPTTAQEHRQLDRTICKVWRTYEAMPDRSDFLFDVLEEVEPSVQWPAVIGDHPSVYNLQAIVGYRIAQIGNLDSAKDFEGNLDTFCTTEGTQPQSPLHAQVYGV